MVVQSQYRRNRVSSTVCGPSVLRGRITDPSDDWTSYTYVKSPLPLLADGRVLHSGSVADSTGLPTPPSWSGHGPVGSSDVGHCTRLLPRPGRETYPSTGESHSSAERPLRR